LKNQFIPQLVYLQAKQKEKANCMKKPLVQLIVLLAIIAMAVPIISTGRAASDTGSIKVQNYSYYIDSLGYLVVVGEVVNKGSNTIQSVGLTGTVTTATGTVNSGANAFVVNLLPNQKAPFYMEFINAPNDEQWASQQISDVKITVGEATTTANYNYPSLTISNDQASIGSNKGTVGAKPTDANYGDYGVYWINGKVTNTGSETAKGVTIVGTFYNSAGTVVAVGLSETYQSLASSASQNFKFGAWDMNQSTVPADKKIATYSLLIQVEDPVKQGAAPSISPTTQPSQAATLPPDGNNPTSIPTVSSNPTDGGATGTNTADNSILIYAAVAIVVIVAVIGTLLVIKRRKQ
jgi:hypothetical protein